MTSTFKHGASAYNHRGCRCPTCTEAHRKRHARAQARRFATRELVAGVYVSTVPNLKHGTRNAYVNYGCRCTACYVAGQHHNAQSKARLKANRGTP